MLPCHEAVMITANPHFDGCLWYPVPSWGWPWQVSPTFRFGTPSQYTQSLACQLSPIHIHSIDLFHRWSVPDTSQSCPLHSHHYTSKPSLNTMLHPLKFPNKPHPFLLLDPHQISHMISLHSPSHPDIANELYKIIVMCLSWLLTYIPHVTSAYNKSWEGNSFFYTLYPHPHFFSNAPITRLLLTSLALQVFIELALILKTVTFSIFSSINQILQYLCSNSV